MYWVITCTLIWICLCNHKYELHTSHCFQYDLISVTTCCHFHGHVSRPTSREVKSLSGYTYSLLPETHITNTPMKFNMETENQPMRRRFLLETMIFRFHLKLWGCIYFHFYICQNKSSACVCVCVCVSEHSPATSSTKSRKSTSSYYSSTKSTTIFIF